MLVYTSEPLERPVDVIGTGRGGALRRSSALDTDITAKLVDVHPDGRAEILTDGILRARYRHSLRDAGAAGARPRSRRCGSTRGRPANLFLPGHRIRLDVSSSNFPRFDAQHEHRRHDRDRHLGRRRARHQPRLPRQRAGPSRLLLPVVERD